MCSGLLNPALKFSANHKILCRSYLILPNIMSSAKGLAFCGGFFFGRRSDPPFGRRFLFCRSAKIDLRLNTAPETQIPGFWGPRTPESRLQLICLRSQLLSGINSYRGKVIIKSSKTIILHIFHYSTQILMLTFITEVIQPMEFGQKQHNLSLKGVSSWQELIP